ncbi:hypothetical protein TNCV_4171541 [Trichonephila clavipes]|nr:hypothetical protein TNCV_4171541 [Trichonephila clavipes]
MIYASGPKKRRLVYNHKTQKLISYSDIISYVICLIFRRPNIPVSLPPIEFQQISRYIRSQVDRGNLCWPRYSQAYEG